MTITDTLTLAQIPWALAGAKGADGQYVFGDEVRLPCPNRLLLKYLPLQKLPIKSRKICTNCHGLGWTPAKEGWWEAAREAGLYLRLWTWRSAPTLRPFTATVSFSYNRGLHEELVAIGSTEAEARNRALLAAVQAMQGVILGEVTP